MHRIRRAVVFLVFLFVGVAAAQPKSEALHTIHLRSRVLTVPSGVDPAVDERGRRVQEAGVLSIHLILGSRDVLGPAAWKHLAANGIAHVSYLGDGHYFVRMIWPPRSRGTLSRNLRAVGGVALTPFQPQDKVSPRVRADRYDDWAYDRHSGLLRVVIRFFPDTPDERLSTLIEKAHRGDEPAMKIASLLWAIRIRPEDAPEIAETEAVEDIDVGPPPQLPLMHDARRRIAVDSVQQIDLTATGSMFLQGLSGKGIRISTNEGLEDHDDFWDHDATGARTTHRVSVNCSPGLQSPHGAMTSGIALGNGFGSVLEGGSTYQYRGIAPEAIYDCGGSEDIVSRSFVQTLWGGYDWFAEYLDGNIRGDNGGDRRPQSWAVANQGITSQWGSEKGYYSVYAPAKNPIVVANVSAGTLNWMESSIGPTQDGRIKPDLSAPGTKEGWPEDVGQIVVDLDFIKLRLGGGNSLDWNFGNLGQQGWGGPNYWTAGDIAPPSTLVQASVGMLRVPLQPPPHNGWRHAPMIGTLTEPNGTSLSISASPTDRLEVRYRVAANPLWRPGRIAFAWMTDKDTYDPFHVTFDLVADGQWHTAVVPIGLDPDWKSLPAGPIDYLSMIFGAQGMLAPSGLTHYSGAGGSSAAAPVVSGAMALLSEQLAQKFGVQVSNRTAASPFWRDAAGNPAPGPGTILPSTLKAVLTQGANDLAFRLRSDERDNPDTQAKTIYHDGPDLVTGYGAIDVATSSRIIDAHTNAQPTVVEREIANNVQHNYTIVVPSAPRAPLKVTLAWDDPASSAALDEVLSHLTNNLNLSLQAPNGTVFHPFTIEPPYTPTALTYPSMVEPEPIVPANIKPARTDTQNNRDNMEQVLVPNPIPGVWTVSVKGTQLWAGPQKYSLVLGTPPLPATHLSGGKVVFVSDRVNPPQLFVKQAGASTPPPVQLTNDFMPAQHPRWSPNGRFVAYITTDVVVGPNVHLDGLKIITENGAFRTIVHADKFGAMKSLGYPQWADDGRRIVLTYWYTWGQRGLATVTFPSSSTFTSTPVVTQLILPGGPLTPNEAAFSRDGRFIYFTADSSSGPSQLWRIPASGGTPVPVYGNGALFRRVFAPSVSPDGTRLLFNSEMWNEDPVRYQHEEVLELGLLTAVIRQVTKEPGHQYASFARNGAGEVVMQSTSSLSAKVDLFLEENGVRIPLDTADPTNAWMDGAPDWWKAPCGGGTVIWANGEAVGCKFSTWGPEQQSICGSWTPLVATGNGSCQLCVEAASVPAVLSGPWTGFTEGPSSTTTIPADFTCRGCINPPSQMAAWWPLDETGGNTVADLISPAISGTHQGMPTPVIGKVAGGLKFDGVASYVQFPPAVAHNLGTGDFSIDAWVKIDNLADLQSVHVIVEKRQSSPYIRGYIFFLYYGQIGLQLADGVGTQFSNYLSMETVPADGAWHLVAVTVKRASTQGGQFYLDGWPAGLPFDPTGRAATLTTPTALRIGRTTLGAGNVFHGSLDEIELFQRALTAYEMRILYLAGPCGKCK